MRDLSQVLVIDDDAAFLRVLSRQLEVRGFSVQSATNMTDALALVASQPLDAVVLDHGLPGSISSESIRALRAVDPTLTIVVLSGAIDVSAVTEAIRGGAEDVQEKPPTLDLLEVALDRGLQRTALLRTRRVLASQVADPYGILDASPLMKRVMRQVERCAQHDLPMLLVGEPGTGKRILATIVHQISRRADDPFVSLTLADRTTDEVMNALRQLHETTVPSTVFLQDLRTLGMQPQQQLLELMDRRVREIPMFRFVVSTSHDIADDARNGRLGDSLCRRLSTLPVHVPALRERGGAAIVALAERTRRSLRDDFGLGPERFTSTATDLLASLAWPGNVPQLRDVIDEAFARATDAEAIDVPHLTGPLSWRGLHTGVDEGEQQAWSLRTAERRHIATVLALTEYNRTKAARLLGITRTTLYKKIAEYGLGDEA
ncbi:sigma-54-dependent transcriptional regulator [Gemmatimonas sp.]